MGLEQYIVVLKLFST